MIYERIYLLFKSIYLIKMDNLTDSILQVLTEHASSMVPTLEEVKARFPPELADFVRNMESFCYTYHRLTEAQLIDRLRKASRMVYLLQSMGVTITPLPFNASFLTDLLPRNNLEVDWERLNALFGPSEGWPDDLRPAEARPPSVSREEFLRNLEYAHSTPLMDTSSTVTSAMMTETEYFPGKRPYEPPAPEPEPEPEAKKVRREVDTLSALPPVSLWGADGSQEVSTCSLQKAKSAYLTARASYLEKKAKRFGKQDLRRSRSEYLKKMRDMIRLFKIPLPKTEDLATHEEIIGRALDSLHTSPST